MAQHTVRTPGLTGSALIRLLADWAAPDGHASPRTSFADGLSQWTGWTQAIALSAALEKPLAATGTPVRCEEEQGECERVRTALAQSITRDAQAAGRSPLEAGLGFSPYRQCYLARQQAMDTQIAALRERVRAALAASTPEGARLAAVDAVMAQALAAQERRLLGSLPALLEKRFRAQCPAGEGDDPFRDDLQALLLAELELRLQPVQGLLKALGHMTTTA
ncbi:MAG: DUF3348 family protein [Acidovorax sp.]